MIEAAIEEFKRTTRRFGIMSEPRNLGGVRGLARLCHSWMTEGFARREADFVLAIGRHGPPWFRLSGYEPSRIFPFAYFVEAPNTGTGSSEGKTNNIKLGFVGRLECEKGFNLAIEALPHIKTPHRLAVVGDGSCRARAVELAARGEIDYLGVLPIANIAAFMGSLDVLIAPSLTKNDGWGVVISEALLTGTAVIASSAIGASACIVNNPDAGLIAARDRMAIATAVDRLAVGGALTQAARDRRARWSRERISAQAGADYFLEILEHTYAGGHRPPNPLAPSPKSPPANRPRP